MIWNRAGIIIRSQILLSLGILGKACNLDQDLYPLVEKIQIVTDQDFPKSDNKSPYVNVLLGVKVCG